MDEDGNPAQPALAVNCPHCKRLFSPPASSALGAVIDCPFCSGQMRLVECTMVTAQPLESA